MARQKIRDRILEYMRHHEWITPFECLNEFGNYKLATHISTLIREGYKIDKETVYYTKYDGTPGHYVQYHLVSEPEESEM